MTNDFNIIIDELHNNKKSFLIDAETRESISFQKFANKIKKDVYNIKSLDSQAVYILKVDNSIKSLILISTFFYFRKKIILFPKNQRLNSQLKSNFNFLVYEVKVGKRLSLKKISNNKLAEFNFDLLIMSSGSTGKSKLVKLELNKSLNNSISMGKLSKFNKQNIHYMIMPIYHVNSLFFSFLSSLIYKQKVILRRKFYPQEFWKDISKFKIKTTSISPTIVRYLNHFKAEFKKKSFLKIVICSSSFLTMSDYKKFKENFSINITQGYGLSEATNFNSLMPTNQKEIKDVNNYFKDEKFITIGSAIPGNEILIAKNKVIGELAIEGNFLSNGYFGYKNKNLKTILTGDVGYIKKYKKKKFIFLIGRKKEIIKYNGETVYPADIENFISEKIKAKINFFCFGFENNLRTEIGCFIDKKSFKSKILDLLKKQFLEMKYPYLPRYIFVGDIKRFLTNTYKPRRKYLSSIITSNFNNFSKIYKTYLI